MESAAFVSRLGNCTLKDGTVHKHGPWNNPCPWSHKSPVDNVTGVLASQQAAMLTSAIQQVGDVCSVQHAIPPNTLSWSLQTGRLLNTFLCLRGPRAPDILRASSIRWRITRWSQPTSWLFLIGVGLS